MRNIPPVIHQTMTSKPNKHTWSQTARNTGDTLTDTTYLGNDFSHNRGQFAQPLRMPPFEIWLAAAYAGVVLVLYAWRWWYARMEI